MLCSFAVSTTSIQFHPNSTLSSYGCSSISFPRLNMMPKTFLIWLLMMMMMLHDVLNQQINVDGNEKGSKVLSRRKRFIIFPTGSSFSVAVCMTVGVYGNPQFSIFSWALNYGFAYNLPTNASYFLHPPQSILDGPFFDELLGKDDDDDKKQKEEETTTEKVIESNDTAIHDFHDHSATDAAAFAAAAASPSQRRYSAYRPIKFETKPMIQRRYRRDMYKNFEAVIDK